MWHKRISCITHTDAFCLTIYRCGLKDQMYFVVMQEILNRAKSAWFVDYVIPYTVCGVFSIGYILMG